MLVDPNKVNLSEEDIENYLFQHPEKMSCSFMGAIEKWLARQMRVPSGIIDLLGIIGERLVVVEIKNTEIKSEHLTQVQRYAADIQNICPYNVYKIVIGKGVHDNKIQFEADAMDILIYDFSVEFNLHIGGPYSWTKEYSEKLSGQYEEIRNLDFISDLNKKWTKQIEIECNLEDEEDGEL